MLRVRTGSWTGPPEGERAPRVGIGSTVFGVLCSMLLTAGGTTPESKKGVSKNQFLLKGSDFQKWKPCLNTVLKGFTPSTTLAWQASPSGATPSDPVPSTRGTRGVLAHKKQRPPATLQ